MRAVVWEGPGVPMRVEEIPAPRPGAGEVLVRIAATGVCHTDLHVIKGEVAFPAPGVLGHEISGHVEELGEGVEGFAVGERVVGAFIMPCGRAGLAELAVVPATALAHLPDELPLEESAVLGCAAFTAYGALARAHEDVRGRAVVVVAVGGVGSAVVQLARHLGASPVVAVDVDDDKLALASTLGADVVINSRTTDARQAAEGAFDVRRAVTRRFDLDEAPLAYDLLDAGQIRGRAIVTTSTSEAT